LTIVDDPLAARLRSIVGETHVLTDPAVTSSYTVDWTGRWRGACRLVVRPGSVAEVASVVAECARFGAPLVPQGGNTGLVGGGVPAGGPGPGSVLLSLRRLDSIGPVDRDAGQVVAGAGATVAAVHQRAREAGWDFGLDFAARDSATVGGAVATNAGGERVLRHGPARAQVLAVQAVLADGRIISRISDRAAGGPVKDSAGYDLGALLVGSEGTLAVITAVRLRLVPLLPARVVAMLAVPTTDAAQRVVGLLRRRLDTLQSAELFHADGLALVCSELGLPLPFPEEHPTYLLVECAGRADPTDGLVEALAGATEVRDAAVAADAAGRAALWRYREGHAEAINAAGVPVKLDVAVPPAVLARAESDIRRAVRAAAPSARVVLFGHIAEANLHVNVLGATDVADAVTEAVLHTVAGLGGSISAEHGIGRAKAQWLHLSRSAEEIAAMRAIKTALDPAGLLNPGVIHS
jgi:FAD/FMN-containing dehydrogenase